MRALFAAAAVLSFAAPAHAFLEQFGPGDLVYEVALAIEVRGCVSTQDEWAGLFEEKGGHISDFQANVLIMHRNGELESEDGGQTLRLKGFRSCA